MNIMKDYDYIECVIRLDNKGIISFHGDNLSQDSVARGFDRRMQQEFEAGKKSVIQNMVKGLEKFANQE